MKSFLTFSAALLITSSLFAGVYQPPAKLIAAPDANESEWRFRLITYGWLTAVDGNLSLGGITAPIDVSMSDTLDTLDMAYMGYFEVGYDRWSVGLDVVYGKTSDDFAAGGRLFDSFRIELKQLLLTGTGTARNATSSSHASINSPRVNSRFLSMWSMEN